MKINKYNKPKDDARGTSIQSLAQQSYVAPSQGESTGGGSIDNASHADLADYATVAGNLDSASTDWNVIDEKDNAVKTWAGTQFLSKVSDDTAAGNITISGGVKVGTFVTGASGAQISSAGAAEVGSLVSRGSASANSLTVTTTAAVGTQIDVGTFSAGSSGARISSTGAAEVASVKSRSYVEVGNYVADTTGAKIWIADGASHAEVDYLTVRRAAMFREITIKELKHIGGELALTPAAEKCIRVEYYTSQNVLTDNYSQAAYFRCYFDGQDEDGNTITNDFIVDDQVRCQKFDLDDADNGYVSTKYYWRLVVNTGTTNDGYNYIDLSNVSGGYDAASGLAGVPAANDNMVQLGCRDTDYPNRMSAIILSAVSEDAPSTKYYQGIDSFVLEELVKDEGYDPITGYFHTYVYGESYVGAAPPNPATYVKYTQTNGVEIKGKVDMTASSTIDGQALTGIVARAQGATTGTVSANTIPIQGTSYHETMLQKDVYLCKGIEYTLWGKADVNYSSDSIIVTVASGSTPDCILTFDKDHTECVKTFSVSADGWYQLTATSYAQSGYSVWITQLYLEQPSLNSQSHLEIYSDHISMGVEGMSNGNILEETDWRGKMFSETFNDEGTWSSSSSYTYLDEVSYWFPNVTWLLLGADSVPAGSDDPYHWGDGNPWVRSDVYDAAPKLTKWTRTGSGRCGWVVPDAYKRMTAIHLRNLGDGQTKELTQTTTGKFTAGQTYTLSFYYRSSNNMHLFMTHLIDTSATLNDTEGESGAILVNGHAVAYNATDSRTGVTAQANPVIPSSNWEWTFITITFVAKSASTSSFAFHAFTGYTEFEVTMVKMENGREATPWTELTKDSLKRSGLDIDAEKIVATTDHFEIQNSSGQTTFTVDNSGNIVGAGNAKFEGDVEATSFIAQNGGFEAYGSDPNTPVFKIDPNESGGTLYTSILYTSHKRVNVLSSITASSLYYESTKLPNKLILYSSEQNASSQHTYTVTLPAASSYKGHEMEIFCQVPMTYQTPGGPTNWYFPIIKLLTADSNGFYDAMYGFDYSVKHITAIKSSNTSNIQYPVYDDENMYSVRILSWNVSGSDWRWMILAKKGATIETVDY